MITAVARNAASPAGGRGRLMSLDVFRGATIAGMMLVNNPGSWGAAYAPLLHAEWHGWTYTDTIFPFFLWIVGAAVPLSIAKRLEAGQSRSQLFRHAVRRAAILFALGLFLTSMSWFIDGSMGRLGFGEWLHSYLTTVRVPGVLQRIAVCYLVAMAIFLRNGIRGQILWTAGLLIAYWLLMAFVPVPVNVHGETRWVAGLFEKGANVSNYVDSLLLGGHVWKSSKSWDPEGIVSTLPAIATCLFGILTGHLLCAKRGAAEKTAWILVTGALLMWLGELMALGLPINKSLWTSSYSVLMAGLAMIVLGIGYWFIDVKDCQTLVKPLAIYGMNAITVFVLAGVMGRLVVEIQWTTSAEKTITLKSWLNQFLFGWITDPRLASLGWALLWVFGLYVVAHVMYRRKWFLKF